MIEAIRWSFYAAIVLTLSLMISSCQMKDEKAEQRISELEKKVASLEDKSSTVEMTAKAVEQRMSDIETTIKPLEETLTRLVGKIPNEKKAIETSTPVKVEKADYDTALKNLLLLENWECRFARGEYGNSNYSITYTLHNGFNKNIKLIEAGIHFKDLLGAKLYAIKITPDLKILAGKSATDKGLYSINQFMTEQYRLKDLDKKDVVVELVVHQIVFDDNTIMKF